MDAQKIISMAKSQIGIKEYPAGSNNVKYNTAYYGRQVRGSSYPWCCSFVWWIFQACGASSLFYGGQKTAYCPTVENFYKNQGRWFSNGQPGDLALFDFSHKGLAVHIGIVERVNGDGSYTTIEGNTGNGNDANGGAVMRRTRYKSSIRGFARPNYQVQPSFSFTETPINEIGEITSKFLNIRKQPTTQYDNIIGRHAKGDIVSLSAYTNNGWFRVDYPSIGTGYICGTYLIIKEKQPVIKPQPVAPPKPDVPKPPKDNMPDSWAKDIIDSAMNSGILKGDSSGNLNLHGICTRQDIITFMYRFYKNK